MSARHHCSAWSLGFAALCIVFLNSYSTFGASTTGACSPIVLGTSGDVRIDVNCPSGLSPLQLEELKTAIANAVTLQGPLVDRLESLSGTLHVQKTALINFFRILQVKQVPIGDLYNALRQIAKRHLDLIAKLGHPARTVSA